MNYRVYTSVGGAAVAIVVAKLLRSSPGDGVHVQTSRQSTVAGVASVNVCLRELAGRETTRVGPFRRLV